METWYSIYDDKGKESGEVLLETKVEGPQYANREMEETRGNLPRAYRSHEGPHSSRQNVRFEKK